MKPTLYIMCGLPFAGKSTLAKRIANEVGCEIVEIDAIKTSLGLRDVWQEMRAEDWQTIFDEAIRRIRAELIAGRSVIHDSANQTRASRDILREIAAALDCESKVLFVDVPFETVHARWLENKQTGVRMDLPDWAVNGGIKQL